MRRKRRRRSEKQPDSTTILLIACTLLPLNQPIRVTRQLCKREKHFHWLGVCITVAYTGRSNDWVSTPLPVTLMFHEIIISIKTIYRLISVELRLKDSSSVSSIGIRFEYHSMSMVTITYLDVHTVSIFIFMLLWREWSLFIYRLFVDFAPRCHLRCVFFFFYFFFYSDSVWLWFVFLTFIYMNNCFATAQMSSFWVPLVFSFCSPFILFVPSNFNEN